MNPIVKEALEVYTTVDAKQYQLIRWHALRLAKRMGVEFDSKSSGSRYRIYVNFEPKDLEYSHEIGGLLGPAPGRHQSYAGRRYYKTWRDILHVLLVFSGKVT